MAPGGFPAAVVAMLAPPSNHYRSDLIFIAGQITELLAKTCTGLLCHCTITAQGQPVTSGLAVAHLQVGGIQY